MAGSDSPCANGCAHPEKCLCQESAALAEHLAFGHRLCTHPRYTRAGRCVECGARRLI